MKLSAPKKSTWLISMIIAIVGLVSALVAIPFVSPIAFWLVSMAYIVLFLGTMLKGF